MSELSARIRALEERREGILQRISELSARLATPGAQSGQASLAEARQHLSESQISANQARTFYRDALYRAAVAHERAAAAHRDAAAMGTGDSPMHQQMAAFHDDAAAADRRRAAQMRA